MTFELYKIHENVSVIYGISTFKFLYPMSGIDFNLFVKQAVFVFDFLWNYITVYLWSFRFLMGVMLLARNVFEVCKYTFSFISSSGADLHNELTLKK